MRFTEYVSRFSTNTIVVLTVIVSLICLLPIIMLSNRHDSTKIYPKPNSLVYRNGVNELKDNLHASNADSSNYEEEDSKREVLPDNTARKYTLDDEHKNIFEPSTNTGSPTLSVDPTYSPVPHREPIDSKALDDEHKNIIEPSSNTGSPTPSVDLTYSPMPHTEPSDSKVNHIHPNHDHHHRTTEDSSSRPPTPVHRRCPSIQLTRRCRTESQSIQRLWTMNIRTEEKDVSDDCAICITNLDYTNTVTGECGHEFHTDCIGIWLGLPKTTCPLCRADWKPKDLVSDNLKAVLIKTLLEPTNNLNLSPERASYLAVKFKKLLKANKDLDDKERFEADLSVSPDKSKLVKMFSNLIRNDGNVGQSMIENAVFNILNSCLDDMYPVKWQFLKNGNWHEFDDAVAVKVEGHYKNRRDQAEPAILNFYHGPLGFLQFHAVDFLKMIETSLSHFDNSSHPIRRTH
eukprot:511278_1